MKGTIGQDMNTNGVTSQEGTIDFEDGKVRVGALSLKAMARLNNWMRSTLISAARASFDENTTEGDRRAALDAAVRVSLGVHFNSPEGQALISTLEGACELVQTATDLDPEASFRLVRGEESRQAFMAEYAALNDFDKDKDASEDEGTVKNSTEPTLPVSSSD